MCQNFITFWTKYFIVWTHYILFIHSFIIGSKQRRDKGSRLSSELLTIDLAQNIV